MTITQTPFFRILSFGAGAIGTYIAGSLALQGHSVVFLERPQVADELRQNGLHLKLAGQEHIIPEVSTVGSLPEALSLGPFDVSIFALKSFDTAGVLHSLIPLAQQLPPILCLQNGIDNEPLLAQALGSDMIIPGTVTSAIGRRAAGDIVLERLRGMGVAAGHPLSSRLVTSLSEAGLNARLYENANDMKWSKLITNLIGNASSAILDLSPAEIFSHPGLYRLELAQLRECLTVMDAQNVHAVNLPGTPVRLLAFAVKYLPVSISRPLLRRAVGKGRGAKMPSFHIDLHSGRGQSEVDYLNGAIVRAGIRLGIPTPANQILTNTLLGLTHNPHQKNNYYHQPEHLLEELRKLRHVQ